MALVTGTVEQGQERLVAHWLLPPVFVSLLKFIDLLMSVVQLPNTCNMLPPSSRHY